MLDHSIFFRTTSILCLLFITSCATPQLKKWEEKKITLCCPQYACKNSTWGEKIAAHCKGTSTQIGGETVEKVVGYQSENTTESMTDKYGKIEKGSLTAKKEVEECRTYECSTNIVEQ